MAYLVVLSEQAEAKLRQVYVRGRLRWEDIQKALAINPRGSDEGGTVRCMQLNDRVRLCRFFTSSFPFVVMYTIEELAQSGSGVVVVRRFVERRHLRPLQS